MDDARSQRPSTVTSNRRSSNSTRSGQSAVATITTDNWRKRVVEDAKLFLLTIPSLVVVTGLCALSLKAASASIQLQTTLEANVRDAQRVGQVVAALQNERGRTCVYMTVVKEVEQRAVPPSVFSNGNNSTDVIDNAHLGMQQARRDTDSALQDVTHWLGNQSDEPQFANKSAFLESVAAYRQNIQLDDKDCEISLQYYTSLNMKLLEHLNRPFAETEDGRFWSLVASYHSILLAKDYVGLERAMGGAFYTRGAFPFRERYAAFSKILGAGEQFLSYAMNLSPEANSIYSRQLSINSDLMLDLSQMRQHILDHGLEKQTPDAEKGQVWFDNMTTYLSMIDRVIDRVSNMILKTLENKSYARKVEYYLTIAAVIAVLLLCPPITCWYAIESRKLMHKIGKVISRLTVQTRELSLEKQRTDFLLYQLLPKTVAMELKQTRVVTPEHYEEATVYFSDIQGFTTLATKSTPLQVIEFLNQLYTKCDQILDQNDVYKVETIGDAYMVVSGIPRRNGKNHSAEMASAALNILMAMEEFFIPHMPDQRLLMRIGIHTGPVAAGVVGNKMPRYCLFGDTVTTASKMESTSQALRIHTSPWTNDHLQTWHPGLFDTVERGTVEIKTKGPITTYWLVGKKGLPFRADLDRASEIAARMTYWRI